MCKAVIPLIKMFHDLLKDIFPKVLPTQEKVMPTKRCVECYKHSKRKETVLVLCLSGWTSCSGLFQYISHQL
jgi:hypothetical protein